MPPNVAFGTSIVESTDQPASAGRKRWYVAAAALALLAIGAIGAVGGPEDSTTTAADQIQSAVLPMVDDEPIDPESEAEIQGLVGSPAESTTSLSTTSVTSTTVSSTTAPPTTAASTTVPLTTAAPTTATTQQTTAAPTTTAVATTAESTTTTAGCHPAYVECIPHYPGDALNCGDLSSSVKPVHLRDPAWDPYGLDGNDNDGIGCESG